MTRPELSIAIPFYNEATVLPLLRQRLERLADRPSNWEIVFVSDGSSDGSVEFIEEWARTDSSVKLVVLTRNFGQQAAVTAGLSFASGDYVGVMDADLQDEPEVLLEMFRLLRSEPVDIVYAVRARRGDPKIGRLLAYIFYRVFAFLAENPVDLDSGEFCVMSRRAVQLLLGLPENLRFVRGLRAWLGLRSKAFSISRPSRAAGAPQYSMRKRVGLAMMALTSFSTKPLRAGLIGGAVLSLFAVLAAAMYALLALCTNIRIEAPGLTILVLFLLFWNGLAFVYLGILGEYLGHILLEVKARPSFIIERQVNFQSNAPAR